MVTEAKKRTVAEFEELLEGHGVVGIVDMEGLPAPQLQQIRGELRGEATLKMGKNTLIRIALDNQDLEDIEEYVEGPTALLFTEVDAFRLYKKLEENKTKAPASAGNVAPRDIVVEAGETGLPPGPIVGDLQQAGIPAAIEEGGVVVREDTVVADEGSVISAELADALNKLDMKPMEIGLKLRGVYEDGSVFEPDVLEIDEAQYRSDIETAAARAFNLAVNAGYPTKESLPVMLSKAAGEARSLALEAEVLEPEIIEELLSRADSQALGIASQLGEDALDEEAAERLSSSGGTEAAPEEKQKPEEAEEEEEEEEDEGGEDEAAEGLGNLF